MAEFKEDLKIPQENLMFNTKNKHWQEIRRASNIFASIILNFKSNISNDNIKFNEISISELYLHSDSVAIITNMSFSIELALKCILEYQGHFKRGHELDDLFKELNPRTKKFIIRYLNINFMCHDKIKDENDFVSRLKPVGNLYEKYRYFFDVTYNLKNYNEDLYLLIQLFYLLIKYINYKLK